MFFDTDNGFREPQWSTVEIYFQTILCKTLFKELSARKRISILSGKNQFLSLPFLDLCFLVHSSKKSTFFYFQLRNWKIYACIQNSRSASRVHLRQSMKIRLSYFFSSIEHSIFSRHLSSSSECCFAFSDSNKSKTDWSRKIEWTWTCNKKSTQLTICQKETSIFLKSNSF